MPRLLTFLFYLPPAIWFAPDHRTVHLPIKMLAQLPDTVRITHGGPAPGKDLLNAPPQGGIPCMARFGGLGPGTLQRVGQPVEKFLHGGFDLRLAPGRRTKNRLRHARPLGPGPGNAKTPDHTLKAQLQLAAAETALGLAQPHPQTPLVGLQVPLPDLPHEITALCPPPFLFHLAGRPSESRLRLTVQGSRLLGKTPGRRAVPAGDRPIQIPLDLLALDRERTRIDPLQ